MGHVFQASEAIEKYNKTQMAQWMAKPQDERGPKPTALSIPNTTELKAILQEIDKEKKATPVAKEAQISKLESKAVKAPETVVAAPLLS